MSIPAHLWLTDESGSPIIGGCLMPSRSGSIELKTLTHNVSIPVDPNWGKLTGTRVHSPIIMQKEFDQTTPLLFRAVCQGRKLKSAVFKMYRTLDAGIESEYFNIELENVIITSVSPSLLPGGITSTHLETIEMRYETITWKYVDGNILFKDAWNECMTS